jgi:hypothetical protein
MTWVGEMARTYDDENVDIFYHQDGEDCTFYSDCCGMDLDSLAVELQVCPNCRDHCTFKCECGATYNVDYQLPNLGTNRKPKCICSRCTVRVGV